MHKNQPERSQR